MSVRNALAVMRDHELLETRRGRGGGTFVQANIIEKLQARDLSHTNLDDFTDLTVWRSAVSGEACARAAHRVTADDVRELHELNNIIEKGEESWEEARFMDARLHILIAELSGSRRLVEAEQQIQDQLTRWFGSDKGYKPDYKRMPSQGHVDLIKSIASGDPEFARAALQRHVSATLDLVIGVGFSLRSPASLDAQ